MPKTNDKSENKLPKNDVHIYLDDKTGDMYIFNGVELIKVGNKSPQIGDKGDEDFQEEEEKKRQAQIEKEKEEFGDDEEEESEEDRQKRIDDIKNALEDEVTKSDIEKETSTKVDKDIKKKKAAQDKMSKASSPIQRFKTSLDRFLADQVKRQKNKTWKKSDMRYEGSGIMRRGKTYTRNTKIPKINVYFDQSGSWGPEDIKVGMQAIGVLNNYEKRGEIEKDIYYFSDHITSTPVSGGTGAGAELVEHIIATKPDNVIIMTDSDMDYQGWTEILSAPKIKVPGAVWFLFRGAASKALPEWIQGRKQTKSFII